MVIQVMQYDLGYLGDDAVDPYKLYVPPLKFVTVFSSSESNAHSLVVYKIHLHH